MTSTTSISIKLKPALALVVRSESRGRRLGLEARYLRRDGDLVIMARTYRTIWLTLSKVDMIEIMSVPMTTLIKTIAAGPMMPVRLSICSVSLAS